jgi:hypothetical protein
MQQLLNFIDEQRNADMLDALADIAHEQEQAMRESAKRMGWHRSRRS